MKRIVILAITHLVALAVGFGAGVYFLPILTAEDAPEAAVLEQQAQAASYQATLVRDLPGSDALHWAEGTVSVSADTVSFQGELAPGPDYKVYLTNGPVETAEDFLPLKEDSVRLGNVKSFDGFSLDVPPGVDVDDFTTVVIWCERFSVFISAGEYRPAA